MEGRIRRIRDWSESDRPRDKLNTKKPAELSTVELLSLLVGPGNARCNSIELAKNVLAPCGNRLADLCKCSVKDLMRVSGIGYAKACALVAFGELSRRHQSEKAMQRPVIKDSRDAAGFLRPRLEHLHHEVFGVIFLGRGGQTIDFKIISQGGITSTVVDPRMVFQEALRRHAVSIVAGHNRPSGSHRPRNTDEALTAKLCNGGKCMDIKLLDHIIIGESGYFSFADEGLLC
jgi:DNA repair protein RadC